MLGFDEIYDRMIALFNGIFQCVLCVCSWPELWVMGLFMFLALLWITKQPQFVKGWGDMMPNKYVVHHAQ